MAEHVGHGLKAIRLSLGLSVRKMADALGLPTTTYQSREDRPGKHHLPMSLATPLAEMLSKGGHDLTGLCELAGVDGAAFDHLRDGGDVKKRDQPSESAVDANALAELISITIDVMAQPDNVVTASEAAGFITRVYGDYASGSVDPDIVRAMLTYRLNVPIAGDEG